MTDYADKYLIKVTIASSLDFPSVYMGGPSKGSLQRAERIISALEDRYTITPNAQGEKEAAMVRTWMNPDGTRKAALSGEPK
jgi:hypothetical protein